MLYTNTTISKRSLGYHAIGLRKKCAIHLKKSSEMFVNEYPVALEAAAIPRAYDPNPFQLKQSSSRPSYYK